MILIDTSALIDSLSSPRRSAQRLRTFIEDAHRLAIPTLVLYEWRRGPRRAQELAAQEALLPSSGALAFGPAEADLAGDLYKKLQRPCGREIDLAIAAHAILQDAVLWTLNPRDFADIPGLKLVADDT